MFPTLWLDSDLSLLIVRVLWGVTWSGTLVAAAALATSRLLARQSSARYLLQSAALLAIVLLVPLWTIREWHSSAPQPGVPAATSPQPLTGTTLNPRLTPSSPSLPLPLPLPEPQAESPRPVPASRQRTDWATATEAAQEHPEAAPAPIPWDRIAQGIAALYLAGAVTMLARLLLGLYGGERLKSGGHPVLDPELRRLLETQARRLGLAVLPALRACERTAIPVVVGLFRPVILFPAAMLAELPPGDLAGILLHELAHLRRYDHVVLLLQRLVEAVLFFHPAVWLLSRAMSRTREECCDDLVLSHGGDAIAYAQSLLRVAELRLGPTAALTGLSMTGTRPSELRRRIMRVLGLSPDPAVRLTRGGLAAVLGAVAVTAAASMAWLTAAERPKGPSDAPVIEFDNGLEVEFLGLSFHPSAGRPWWKPDGTPLERRPYEESGNKVHAQTPEEAELCREWAFEFRKLPTPFLQERVIVEGETLGSAGGRSCEEKKCVLYRAGGPVKDRKSTTVRIGFAVSDDLPPRLIDPQGRKTIPDDTLPAVRLLDDRIRFRKLNETDDTVELVLDSLGTLWDDASFEFFALDADGKETRSNGSAGTQETSSFVFPLAPAKLQSFGYRLRPYTHWVTFRNVSLAPDHPTQLKVETEVLARYLPALATVDDQRDAFQTLQQAGVFLVGVGVDGPERMPAQYARRPIPITECVVGGVNREILRQVGRLAALESLHLLNGRSDHSLEQLSHLKNLKMLWTGSTEVMARDFASLRELPRLEVLRMDTYAQIAHPLEWYQEQLPQLTPAQTAFLTERGKTGTSRKCCYDAFLNDAALEVIESLPRLERMELLNAYMTDAGFRHLTSRRTLKSLKVNGGFLTEEGLRTIRNCPELEELDIAWGPWTETALADLEGFRHLKSIRFWCPEVPISQASLARLKAALPACLITHHPQPGHLEHQDAPPPETIRVQLQNFDTSAPVIGAEVQASFYPSRDKRPESFKEAGQAFRQWIDHPMATFSLRSDGEGWIEVPLPEASQADPGATVRFEVRHPDYRTEQDPGFRTLSTLIGNTSAPRTEARFSRTAPSLLISGVSMPAAPQPTPRGPNVILVDPGVPVSGLVLGSNGQPAANVPILGGSSRQDAIRTGPHTRTDAAGRYQVRVPRLSKRLYVLPENAAAVSRAIDLQSVEQPVFRLRSGTTISGRVLDVNGHPVRRAVVKAEGDTRTPYRFARTNDSGTFTLPPVPAGEYDVRPIDRGTNLFVQAFPTPDLLPGPFVGHKVSIPRDNPPATAVVELRAAESVRVTARVEDSQGQPTAGSEFRLIGNNPAFPREAWLGQFVARPGEVGVYDAMAPKGLFDGRIEASAVTFALGSRVDRVFRRLPGSQVEAPAVLPRLEADDDTLVMRRLREGRVTLRFQIDGQEPDEKTSLAASLAAPSFVDPQRQGAGFTPPYPFSSRSVSLGKPLTIPIHPKTDIWLELNLPGYPRWTRTVQLQEGEEREITVNFTREAEATAVPIQPHPPEQPTGTPEAKPAPVVILQWTQQPSARDGGGGVQVRLTVASTGEATAYGDFRNRKASLQLSEAEVETLMAALLKDHHIDRIAGDAFNQPPNLWESGVDRIELAWRGQSVDLKRTGGWSQPDESIRNYLGAVDRLSRTVSFVRAGGQAAIDEALPVVNEGLLREFPSVAPFTATDFMAAEALQATGSRVLTFRRERTEGAEREEIRADIEIPPTGAPNLLSVERNNDRRRLERPPEIPGIPLAGVPVTGKWSSVAAVYIPREPAAGEVGQFYRLRDGVRTVELTPTLDAHLLPGGRELYIEHADPIRRNLYGPIAGDAEALVAAARAKLDAASPD